MNSPVCYTKINSVSHRPTNPARQRAFSLVQRPITLLRNRPYMIHFPEDHAHMPEIRPMAEQFQLPLFPDQAALIRIRPERNEWRYYRLAVWPDLFGRALLARQWGRIGTQGRVRLDPHPDAGAAINALARLAHAKRRRGYRDRAW
jgi:predicted DNA-binding WGR domain protein